MGTTRATLFGPIFPIVLLTVMFTATALSLVSGTVDVGIPALRGERPFGLLFEMKERVGPGYVFLHIFVHNLGLACLVPGLGLFAAALERRQENRKRIAMMLLATVVITALTALQYIVQAGFWTDVRIVGLAIVEVTAVLMLAVVAYKPVSNFVPTRALGWSLVKPMREIRGPFVAATAVLAAASVFEVMALLG